jgi:hypothetical protein
MSAEFCYQLCYMSRVTSPELDIEIFGHGSSIGYDTRSANSPMSSEFSTFITPRFEKSEPPGPTSADVKPEEQLRVEARREADRQRQQRRRSKLTPAQLDALKVKNRQKRAATRAVATPQELEAMRIRDRQRKAESRAKARAAKLVAARRTQNTGTGVVGTLDWPSSMTDDDNFPELAPLDEIDIPDEWL